MSKNIALTGGGTAGHITPNLALIPELKKRGFNIIYIGSKNGMDESLISKSEIKFFGITADKLRRYFDIKNFAMPINVLRGINEAKKILKENNIDIVFSKGGYVALPVTIAAHKLGIPVISHEADFTPGLANKIASFFSKKVCTNFEETAKMLKNKGVHTGCPIRSELLNGNKEKGLKFLGFNQDKPIIFITGGSLGSQYINELIRYNLDTLLKKYNIVHQCGKGKCIGLKRLGYKELELIDKELPDVFAASDLIISRAGANILFEILAIKKLNLLIPLSLRASRGDQILNAKSFQKKNYSVVLFEEEQNNNNSLFLKKLNEIETRKNEILNALNNAHETDAINKICDTIQLYSQQ